MFGFFNSASRRLNTFNRTRGGLSKIIKIMGIFLVFGFSVALVITLGEDDQVGGSDAKGTQFVKRVETEKLPETNPDGTVNGLNLLLINKMEKGYAREYLEICAANESGKLGNFAYPMPVTGVLATSVNETGFYPNTVFPKSYLPYDDKGVVWNRSYGGYPAEALTLSKLNKHVISQPAIGGFGNIKTNSGADNVGAPGSDYSVTPFQINLYGPTSNHPIAWKSNMNGYQESNRLATDIIYFPDQLGYLNNRLAGTADHFDFSKLNSTQQLLAFSLMYNPGSGNALKDEFNGKPYKTEENYKQLKVLEEELNYVFETYGDDISKLNGYQTQQFHMYIALALVKDRGWKVRSTDYQDMISHGQNAWNFLKGEGSLSDFVQSNLAPFSRALNRSGAGLMLQRDGVEIRTDTIALGHAYTKAYIGNSVYARMLQASGLADVDPTNPDTYMNRFEDEWLPNGTGDWLKECGVDPSNLNPKILAILNEGYKLRGTPYYLGDPIVPKKNADGSYDVKTGRFDCSSFLQYIIKTITNIDIGRNTTMQLNSPNLEDISMKDLKTGDIIILGNNGVTEHVIMYLSGDATTNSFWYMDTGSNATGGVKVTNNASYQHANRKQWWPKRVKGID